MKYGIFRIKTALDGALPIGFERRGELTLGDMIEDSDIIRALQNEGYLVLADASLYKLKRHAERPFFREVWLRNMPVLGLAKEQ